jgi:orotate phosphoribosyltransferase
MPNAEVLRIFEETGALMTGHFVLRSGLHSGHFFQCARVCEHMDKVERLAELLLAKIEDKSFQTVLSPAMGGLVIGRRLPASPAYLHLCREGERHAGAAPQLPHPTRRKGARG